MATTTVDTSPCPPTSGPCIPECTGRVDITFDSPPFQIVQPVAPGSIVENTRLIVEMPFNGVDLALAFGTQASPTLIMAPSDSDLSTVAEYVIPAGFLMTTSDGNLVLNLVLGGSTQGKATLLYDVRA